jgi:DNA-binding HxlR family transcriptional regulator
VVARPRRRQRLRITLNFSAYPLRSSLGALGRKWALLVLMNIAFGRAQRFNELLRTTPGMSKRILAMRLNDLERGGFILRAEQRRGFIRWQLSEKGADILPVILTLLRFGAKWRRTEGEGPLEDASLGNVFHVTVGALPPRGRAPSP